MDDDSTTNRGRSPNESQPSSKSERKETPIFSLNYSKYFISSSLGSNNYGDSEEAVRWFSRSNQRQGEQWNSKARFNDARTKNRFWRRREIVDWRIIRRRRRHVEGELPPRLLGWFLTWLIIDILLMINISPGISTTRKCNYDEDDWRNFKWWRRRKDFAESPFD